MLANPRCVPGGHYAGGQADGQAGAQDAQRG
jgi:hypothetical protein